jgi:hypothetical protein
MAQGRTSPQAWELLDEMTLRFENVEVRTRAEQVLYGEALDRINELADARNAGRIIFPPGRILLGRIANAMEVPDGSLEVTTSNLDGYGSPVTERHGRILRLAPKSRKDETSW